MKWEWLLVGVLVVTVALSSVLIGVIRSQDKRINQLEREGARVDISLGSRMDTAGEDGVKLATYQVNIEVQGVILPDDVFEVLERDADGTDRPNWKTHEVFGFNYYYHWVREPEPYRRAIHVEWFRGSELIARSEEVVITVPGID